MSGDLLLMGVIVGVHGIRGEVKIKTFSESPDTIAAYGALRSKSGTEKFKIKRHRVAKGVVVAKLIGVNDRNAAEALKGTELFLPRDRLPELSDAEEHRRRFLADLEIRKQRNLPPKTIDERLLAALEHGLPDCAGVALGVDRLVMKALGLDAIDEVLSFRR